MYFKFTRQQNLPRIVPKVYATVKKLSNLASAVRSNFNYVNKVAPVCGFSKTPPTRSLKKSVVDTPIFLETVW